MARINGMFRGCAALEAVDVSAWKTGSLTQMTGTFRDCPRLKTPDVSGWNLRNVAQPELYWSEFLDDGHMVNGMNWQAGLAAMQAEQKEAA